MKKWQTAILTFAAVGGLLAWTWISEDKKDARMTAKGTAILTSIYLDEDDESRSLDETDFDYHFDAGGRQIESSDSLPGDKVADYRIGQRVTICYNPSDPAESSIETDPNVKCGS